jgi:hypothetical protein
MQPSRPRPDSLDQTSVVSFVFSQFPCALDLYRFFLISFLFGKKNVVVNFFFPAKRFIGKKMLLFFMKFSRNSSTNWWTKYYYHMDKSERGLHNMHAINLLT